MLAIRMQRTGRSGHAQFRVIVQDRRFSPKRGRIVSYLGSYNPHTKAAQIDSGKAAEYLKNGAQPSDRVARLFKKEGIKLPAWVRLDEPKKRTVRNPEKRRSTAPEKPAGAPPEATAPADEAQAAAADNQPEPAAEEPAAETPAEQTPTEPQEPESESKKAAEPPKPEAAAEPATEKPQQKADESQPSS